MVDGSEVESVSQSRADGSRKSVSTVNCQNDGIENEFGVLAAECDYNISAATVLGVDIYWIRG